MMTQDLILLRETIPVSTQPLSKAPISSNMLTARLDYNLSEDKKIFIRLGMNSRSSRSENSLSMWRNQLTWPSAAFGLDWNGKVSCTVRGSATRNS